MNKLRVLSLNFPAIMYREHLIFLLAKLRSLNKIPENGIVYFAGIINTGANRTGMLNEVLIPPEPVLDYIYRCDSVFLS